MRLSLLFIIPSLLFGWANPGTFSTYKNRVFVETGSFLGDGIQEALNAGFEKICSVTLEEPHYIHCKMRFADQPNVHLHLGDSGQALASIIENIHEPITFWLDAHNDNELLEDGKNTPILKELEAIKNHPIKTHTILIDDVRLFNTKTFDNITLATIYRKIFEINPKYRITFIDGFIKRDILVAQVP